MNDQNQHFYDQTPDGTEPDKNQIREVAAILNQHLPVLLDGFERLKKASYLTQDDKELLFQISKVLLDIAPYINYIQNYLGESLYKQATAYYYHVKELASKGNPEAQKIVDDLKPLYEQSLGEQMGEN